MDNIRGYEIRNKRDLSHWQPLIEEWMLAIERYCRISEGDAPYWYNERANIGVLSGAAWRCGRIALEEFQYEKEKKNGSKPGRADLWISFEKGSQTDEELIEAKFKEISLQSLSPIEIAETQLKKALSDAKETKGKDDIRSIGVSFLYLNILKKKANNLPNIITEFIDEIKKSNYELMAWTFPVEMQVPDSERNYISPGVIMMASVV
jgi:hypothetical protein